MIPDIAGRTRRFCPARSEACDTALQNGMTPHRRDAGKQDG